MDERGACIGFSLAKNIGPLRFKLLLDYFSTAEKAWSADKKTLLEIGLGEKLTQKFIDFRKSFSYPKFLEDCARREIKIVTRYDPDFPKLLLEIADPPIVLYVKGTLPVSFDRAIGVVGTRKPTSYGRQISEMIARDLVASGCLIVSGLARGVDGIAHTEAVKQGQPTIAVLGCGVDIVYPPEHRSLYSKIIETGGAIISEVPPGHLVAKGLFPARNRIISGLSRGIVVTEGAEDSGSLITASLALEQGKEVFAVPGPINSYLSAGPTKLIKSGAKLVTSAADILDEFALPAIPIKATQNNKLSQQEQQIIALMSAGTLHFDDIVRGCHLPTSEVGSILTLLELSGIIQNLGEGKYALSS